MSDNQTFKWRAEEEFLLKLLLATNSPREISEQINRRHDAKIAGFPCTRSEDAVRRKINRDNLRQAITVEENPVSDRFKVIQEIQEKFRADAVDNATGVMPADKATTKILSLSDLHIPFARMDHIQAALDKHNDADIVVLNGDIMDGYIYSTYDKNRRVAALDEYRAAFDLVDQIRLLFPKVVLTRGNHMRTARALKRAGFEQEASQVLRPDLLARIANGEVLDKTGLLVDKKNFDNVYYQQNESWYVRIGKTLFVHPHGRGSAKPGYTVQRVQQYFSTRYAPGEIDCIVSGHTHKIYKGIHNRQLLIEQGCMADLMGYAHKPKLEFIGNGVNGYAVIYQDEDGNCDWNRSGVEYLGEVLPPKKSII